MKLTPKDLAGILFVAGTGVVLALHNGPFGHRASHSPAVADAGGSVTSPSGERPTAFVDFNVVPMDGDRVLRNQVVVVRGAFIERMGRVGFVEPPRNALRIEGNGTRYLAPGLTDAHVHLPDGFGAWLPLFLANGVTTVFNLEGNEGHLAAKDRIWSGLETGPAVYTAGPYVGEPEIRSPAAARAAVARHAALGYDFVKVHGTLSAATYRELISAAREHDLPVLGHAPRNLPLSVVLESGQVALTHAEEIIHTRLWTLSERELPELAEEMAQSGVWMIPTLAHFRDTAEQWGSPEALAGSLAGDAAAYMPRGLRTAWRASNPFVDRDSAARADILEMRDFHVPLIRTLHDAGVPLMAGTDTPLPVSVPGFSLHREIAALADVGLSGYEALATATRNPGLFVSTHVRGGAVFGVVQPGARADILVLDGDPRASPETLRRPRGVLVRGRWYPRSRLDRMLAEVAAN